jgi:hypothetical protein
MTYQIALMAVFKLLVILSISSGILLPLKAAEPDQSEIDWITLVNHQQFLETRLTDIEKYLDEDELYQFAADELSQERFADYRELMDTKLAALETRSQAGDSVSKQDMEALKGLLKAMSTDFDRALSQQHSALTRLEVFLAGLGIFVVIAGLAGYYSVKTDSQAKAKEGAKKWLDEKHEDIETRMNEFSSKMDPLESEAKEKVASLAATIEKAQEVIKPDAKDSDESQKLSDEELKDLFDAATKLQSKPESSYGFEDWNTRALAAYHGNEIYYAVVYWDKATKLLNASDIQISQALFNKGVVLGQLQKQDEAFKAYEEIINRYNNHDNTELRALCATALENAAELYLSLNRHKDAIKAIDQAMLRVEKNTPRFATLTFLQWLVGVGELQSVVSAIKALDETVHFNCSFELLRPWVKQSLDRQRQQQAECLMAFFEQHQDIQQLEQCLENS